MLALICYGLKNLLVPYTKLLVQPSCDMPASSKTESMVASGQNELIERKAEENGAK